MKKLTNKEKALMVSTASLLVATAGLGYVNHKQLKQLKELKEFKKLAPAFFKKNINVLKNAAKNAKNRNFTRLSKKIAAHRVHQKQMAVEDALPHAMHKMFGWNGPNQQNHTKKTTKLKGKAAYDKMLDEYERRQKSMAEGMD